MVQLWVLMCLIFSAFAVSLLGAWFSILGLGKLFAGAVVAVWMMAGALELAKFTIAAFLHQIWKRLNPLIKTYLLVSVVILSLITSMGIFGFLSDAYQEASSVLEGETIRLESLKAERLRLEQEIVRINNAVEEIPANRITKKMKARAEAEPLILQLKQRLENVNTNFTGAQLKVLDVKNKVGPLIYIAKLFNVDVDTAVKYLILALVSVFDPLAICLVVAVSFALAVRKNPEQVTETETLPQTPTPTVPASPGNVIKMRLSK
jgi:hypothetical protein